MKPAHTLVLLLGLVAAAALAILLRSSDAAPDPAVADPPSPDPVTPPPARMISNFVPISDVPQPDEPVAEITYPDGESFPTLNGIERMVTINWPSGRPYAPIIGKMTDGPPEFLEWYVHADGSHSTTALRQYRRGGPRKPMGLVRSPYEMPPGRVLHRGHLPVRK